MKKHQALITGSILLLTTLLFSCSKKSDDSSPAPSNTITATVDGTSTSFNTLANGAETSLTSGGLNIHFILITGKSSNGELMAVDVASPTLTAGKTYSGDVDETGTGTKLEYHDAAGSIYTDENNINSSVSITSISSTSVSGTFTGKVYLYDNNDNVIGQKNITDGKFNVSLKTVN